MTISNGQVSNNGGGGDGTGATSLVVTSPDNSVVQVGESSYSPTLSRLTIALRAVGDGGMTNPMTSAGDMIIGGTASGGVAPPVKLPKGTVTQVLTIDSASGLPAWINNPGLYQYAKQRYVDPINGVDAAGQSGAYGAPWKTVAYALTRITTGMIIVLMGQSPEPAFSISLTNIDIVAFGTRSALNGFNNLVTITATAAGSVRIQNLNMGGGLTRASTSTSGLYLYGGSIGATGFSQLGNGYTEFVDCDASNGPVSVAAGTVNMFGGKSLAPAITGTPTVTFDNLGAILGNSTVASGATLNVFESNWIAGTTGFAITSTGTAVVTMQGNNIIRANGTLAPVSVTLYDIQDQDYDKANSVLGTQLGNVDWFSRLGLGVSDTITTATKMLVRKPTGEIAEQLIAAAPLSFNVPINTVYSDFSAPANIVLRNSSGSTQLTQIGLLCNSDGLLTVQQLFSITVNTGQTLNINGRITFYNLNPITTPNYYVNIQVVGVTAGGQLVNLGTSATQTVLSKVQYAYTNANFTATDTLVTNLVAIGIQAQILYGEANNTSLVNTMFAQLTIS